MAVQLVVLPNWSHFQVHTNTVFKSLFMLIDEAWAPAFHLLMQNDLLNGQNNAWHRHRAILIRNPAAT